jgi:hypothetical protein
LLDVIIFIAMLISLTSGLRYWAATVLVAAYALCLAAPIAAAAFSEGAAHCLTSNSHGLAAVHADAGGTVHQHFQADKHRQSQAQQHSQDGDEQQTAAGQCCGFACLSAVARAIDVTFAQPLSPAEIAVPIDYGLRGGVPDRLYRPPASLLSL